MYFVSPIDVLFKSNLHDARSDTPMRTTSGELIYAAKRLGKQKHRRSGKPLTTLSDRTIDQPVIWTQDLPRR